MSTMDVRHLVEGSFDHYGMALLRMRGYLPRMHRPYRLKPWQEIRRALHAADADCIFLVARFGVAKPRWTAPANIPGPPAVASIVWRLYCGAGHGLCFADHICKALDHGELEDGEPTCPGCHDEQDRNGPLRRAFAERLHAAGWRVGMSPEEAARLLSQLTAATA